MSFPVQEMLEAEGSEEIDGDKRKVGQTSVGKYSGFVKYGRFTAYNLLSKYKP